MKFQRHYIHFLIVMFLILCIPVSRANAAGKNYLAFIAVDDYMYWDDLEKPIQDVRALRDVLVDYYQIDEVFQLFGANANLAGITWFFQNLQEKMTEEDSLLLYFAGHGWYAGDTDTGYLMPFDAGTDHVAKSHWFSQWELRGLIKKLKARHVLLVVDACFSGSLLSDEDRIEEEYTPVEAQSLQSRMVLSSGNLERVQDASPFARILREQLVRYAEVDIDSSTLYNAIKEQWLTGNPQFGVLAGAEHIPGGRFTFFHKKEQSTRDFGVLVIQAHTDVDVYIDNNLYEQGTREARLPRAAQREFLVKIIYPDGYHYTANLFVIAGKLKTFKAYYNFSPQKQGGGFRLNFSSGIEFPNTHYGESFFPGIGLDLRILYALFWQSGSVKAGLRLGAKVFRNRHDGEDELYFFVIPVQAIVGGELTVFTPLLLELEISGGGSILEDQGQDTIELPRYPSLGTNVALMYRASNHWQMGLQVQADFLFLHPDIEFFWNISPRIMIEYLL